MKSETLGTILALAWGILTASKDVVAGSMLQTLDLFAFAFLYTLLTWSYFFVGQLHRLPEIFRKARRDWLILALTNLAILFVWGSTFAALRYIQPAIAGAITICMNPLSAALLAHVIKKDYRANRSELESILIIFFGLVVVVWATFSGHSAMGQLDPSAALIGVLAAVTCGVSMSLHVLLAKSLYDRGWAPAELITARQPLAILVMGVVCLAFGSDLAPSLESLPSLVLLTLIGAAIPIYCVQKSLSLMRPIPMAILLTLLPVYTLIIELLDQRLSTSWASTAGVLLIVAGVLAPKLRLALLHKTPRRAPSPPKL